MKETDPDDVPDFVVRDLHKLPPITFDHVDVTRLLKDITSLKASLAEMQSNMVVSNDTIAELRAEVLLLRNAVSICRSPDAANVNTVAGRKIHPSAVLSRRAQLRHQLSKLHVLHRVPPPSLLRHR